MAGVVMWDPATPASMVRSALTLATDRDNASQPMVTPSTMSITACKATAAGMVPGRRRPMRDSPGLGDITTLIVGGVGYVRLTIRPQPHR
jgi:hypothetical protein